MVRKNLVWLARPTSHLKEGKLVINCDGEVGSSRPDKKVQGVAPLSTSVWSPKCVQLLYHSPGIKGSACLPYGDLLVTVALVHQPRYRRIIATLGILQGACHWKVAHVHAYSMYMPAHVHAYSMYMPAHVHAYSMYMSAHVHAYSMYMSAHVHAYSMYMSAHVHAYSMYMSAHVHAYSMYMPAHVHAYSMYMSAHVHAYSMYMSAHVHAYSMYMSADVHAYSMYMPADVHTCMHTQQNINSALDNVAGLTGQSE